MPFLFRHTENFESLSYTGEMTAALVGFLEHQWKTIEALDAKVKAPLGLVATTTILWITMHIIGYLSCPKGIKNLPMVNYTLPLFYSLGVLFPKAKDWHDSPCLKFANLARQYGNIYQVRLGNRLVVVANSYDSIRALWCNKNVKGNNSRPITHSFHRVLSNGVYTVGTTPMGPTYRKARKHISEKVLSERRNKDYNVRIMNSAADEMIERLMRKSRRRRVIRDSLLKECQYFHLKVALLVTYAFTLDLDSGEHLALADTIIRVENEITKVRSHVQNVQDYLPGLVRYVWSFFSPYERHAQELSKTRETYLEMFHDHAHRQYLYAVQCGVFDETIRESLMFDYFYSSKDSVSKAEIKSICLTMVSAGLDNVALNFKYGIHQLAINPDMWDRGFRELVSQFTSKKAALNHCYTNTNCNYINAIVKETLRLFTVLPMALPRQTTSPIVYQDAVIPANTVLFMNCWAGNHDPSVFPQPLKFYPERYLDHNGNLNSLKHFSYGIGCRMCLGSLFANKELYILFCKFLLKFEPLEDQQAISANPLEQNQFPESLAIEPPAFDVALRSRVT